MTSVIVTRCADSRHVRLGDGRHLADRLAMLEDGKISINEAKRLLAETLAIQKVLIDMKLHLEDEAV